MTRYETSPEVRPLEKTICEFAGLNGYDPMNVFTDFLRYVIHGFSPGAPPLKDWRYKRQQNAAFMKNVCGMGAAHAEAAGGRILV